MERQDLTEESRRALGPVVDRARHHQPTLLTDHGKPAFFAVPPESWEDYQRLREQEDKRIFHARLADTSDPAKTLSSEEDVRRFIGNLGTGPDGSMAASA